jgi:hypothetical protein
MSDKWFKCKNCGAENYNCIDCLFCTKNKAKMKLPVKTDILGDEIIIQEAALEGKLGQWDESSSTITIKSGQSEFGKRVILLHEIMHVVETMLLQNGVIKKRITHEFITTASFGICALLTAAGALEGLTVENIKDFVAEQESKQEN